MDRLARVMASPWGEESSEVAFFFRSLCPLARPKLSGQGPSLVLASLGAQARCVDLSTTL